MAVEVREMDLEQGDTRVRQSSRRESISAIKRRISVVSCCKTTNPFLYSKSQKPFLSFSSYTCRAQPSPWAHLWAFCSTRRRSSAFRLPAANSRTNMAAMIHFFPISRTKPARWVLIGPTGAFDRKWQSTGVIAAGGAHCWANI